MHRAISIEQIAIDAGVRFGTSGARGLVVNMTSEVCMAYTLAFLGLFPAAARRTVAIGVDLRPSSPHIARACIAAARLAGFEVRYCGALPTPALAFFAISSGIPAIMITGSHIPFDRNGIKFYRPAGEISKADEAAIASAQVDLPDEFVLPDLPPLDAGALHLYRQRYLDFFPPNQLAGLRLGLYEHSSVGRDVLRDILIALGAEVISLGRTDTFVPIDTEAVSAEDQEQGRRWSRQHGLDTILSTDGDADRPLIGDEHGNWLRGDIVGLLCARYLAADVVVTPVSSNTALEKCHAFRRVIRTRIGSPYVIEAMSSGERDGDGRVVGFEANGGFLVGSALALGGRRLEPLPTRDATLPMLVLLAAARARGCPLSGLLADLPARFTASDRIQGCPTEASRAFILGLAQSKENIHQFLGPICGEVSSLDTTDGLRMTFRDDRIVHLRPSGNAPELRCYVEADSQAGAEDLLRKCIQTLGRVCT